MKIVTETDYICKTFGYEEGIRLLCEAGYDGLDLSLFAMTQDDNPFNGSGYRELALSLRKAAESRGVFFTQAHAPFSFDVSKEEYFKNVAYPRIVRSIEIAALVGASNIVVHPLTFEPYTWHEQETHEKNIRYFSSLIPYCEKYGIKIAVENMFTRDRKRGYIICAAASPSPRLCSMVDDLKAIAPCFTACLDLGHCGLIGEEAQDAIRSLGRERLGALHIHDNNYTQDQHTLPGVGKMDFTAIADALREIGYRGDFTYEADSFLTRFPKELLPTAVKFMVDVARYWAARCE